METAAVIERVRRVAAVRSKSGVERSVLEESLRSVSQIEAWLAGTKAALTTKLAAVDSFPEKTLADCTRGTTRDAIKDRERASTLEHAPSLADALDTADVTAAHVDAFTNATKGLDDGLRDELISRLDTNLLNVAATASVPEWKRRLKLEIKSLQRDDGMDRLERQRRDTSVRTWTDEEGMWCLSGRFDPVTGVRLSNALDQAVNALFAKETPDTCPADPISKQRHLAALALAELMTGTGVGGRPGRAEYVVVVDTSQPDGAGGPAVDWGIPVDIPQRVLAELMADATVETVVVRNGVVLHASGELNLGRNTRLANRAQRRALRAVYATCAIPGCSVHYDRCKLHHITYWRNGGRTDLANLLPLCAHHHSKVHDANWQLSLGPNRELTLTLPDGTIHNTSPPTRHAA